MIISFPMLQLFLQVLKFIDSVDAYHSRTYRASWDLRNLILMQIMPIAVAHNYTYSGDLQSGGAHSFG